MTTLTPADARAQWRDVGRLMLTAAAAVLYALGWTAVKLLRGIGTAVAAMLFALGWCGRKALPWCLAALREGWDAARPAPAKGGTR